MILIGGLSYIALLSSLLVPLQSRVSEDPTPVARRIAATTRLAAQEYGLGVQNGQVVAQAEVDEARLFLTEARRSAGLLPPGIGATVQRELDTLLAMVKRLQAPDSVRARVATLMGTMAAELGVSLEELPRTVPSLARGAQVFQANCAGCHGTLGRGDGAAAAGMNPPPANLADPLALSAATPLDFYQRITIGVAGTAMPSYETRLTADDRWAAAVYASLLRLPTPNGDVPPALRAFATTAGMSDSALAATLVPDAAPTSALALGRVAAARHYQLLEPEGQALAPVFGQVRAQVDSAMELAHDGAGDAASATAFNAYMTFEQVEPQVRAKDPALAAELEAVFAELRTRSAGGATDAELGAIRTRLAAGLEKAERALGDRLSPTNLFVNSFIIMAREGLEAILILGALVAMLGRMGATHRKRDVHIGAGAAVGASLLTALVLQTVVHVTPARQEAMEGITMLVAVVMLFYVSYWLLSRMEVARWNRFVKEKVSGALTSGSALALASVAFLAVYREGFETVLFYKALFVAGGSGAAAMPVLGGILVGGILLVAVYYAINRFGVRIPLKPFFAITSAFLYYMAFVFAGKGIAELQEGGLVSLTPVEWVPRIPQIGVYQTVETLAAQGLLLALAGFGLLWTFVIEPRRLKVTSEMIPDPPRTAPARRPLPEPMLDSEPDRDLIRSLELMDADLAELRAEIERLKRKLSSRSRN